MSMKLAVGFLGKPMAIAHGDFAREQKVVLLPWGITELKNGATLLVDDEGAKSVLREFEEHGVDIPFDKNHATVLKLPKGEDAPAFGWGKRILAEPNHALCCQVRWTDEGLEEIKSGRYRYLSPVVGYEPETGRVRMIHSVALTTKPATPQMPALAASDVFPPLTEIKPMSELLKKLLQDEENAVATAEQKIGELKKVLEAKGVTLGDGADFVAILNAAIALITGESTDGSEDAEVAASVRESLGLAADAGANEVVLAMRVGGASSELAAMRNKEADRVARARVDHYLDKGVLLSTDKPAMNAALMLARDAPDRSEALMANAVPIVPQGRTTGPDGRDMVIMSAVREYRGDEALQKTTSLAALADLRLRDAGFETMSEDERRDYPQE